jgi:hypothetical protein
VQDMRRIRIWQSLKAFRGTLRMWRQVCNKNIQSYDLVWPRGRLYIVRMYKCICSKSKQAAGTFNGCAFADLQASWPVGEEMYNSIKHKCTQQIVLAASSML